MPKVLSVVGSDDTTHDLFSYAALSREDEASAREDAALIKTRALDALQAWCDIGEALQRQKDKLGHGHFLAWAKHEFEWGRQRVSEFIQINEAWGPNVRSGGHFKSFPDKKAAIEFAGRSTPPEVRAAVESLLIYGETVTVARIRQLKEEARVAKESVGVLETKNAELVAAVENPEPPIPVDTSEIEKKISAEIETKYLVELNAMRSKVLVVEEANKKLTEDLKGKVPAPEIDAIAQKAIDESIATGVSEASEKIKKGYADEVEKLKKEIADLKKPKPVTTIDSDTGNVISFGRPLSEEEAAAIDAENDEYVDADFNQTASPEDRAIVVVAAIRSIASVNAAPGVIYTRLTADRSAKHIADNMAMVDLAISVINEVKEMHKNGKQNRKR